MWYSASILASEAEFIEPPPEIETVTSSSGTYKRHTPAKFTQKSVGNILRPFKESLPFNEIEAGYNHNRNESLLKLCMSHHHHHYRDGSIETPILTPNELDT
jgi:hypothetical protein